MMKIIHSSYKSQHVLGQDERTSGVIAPAIALNGCPTINFPWGFSGRHGLFLCIRFNDARPAQSDNLGEVSRFEWGTVESTPQVYERFSMPRFKVLIVDDRFLILETVVSMLETGIAKGSDQNKDDFLTIHEDPTMVGEGPRASPYVSG